MIFLLDTNVLSETTRKHPEPKVIAWLSKVPRQDMRISSMVLAEVQQGVELNPTRPLKEFLSNIMLGFLIAPFDEPEALAWGRLTAAMVSTGQKIDFRDSIIAATAHAHNWTVATRNVTHFAPLGVAVFDPWDGPSRAVRQRRPDPGQGTSRLGKG